MLGLDKVAVHDLPDEMLLVLYWQERAWEWERRSKNDVLALLSAARDALKTYGSLEATEAAAREGAFSPEHPLAQDADFGARVHLVSLGIARLHALHAVHLLGQGKEISPIPISDPPPWMRRLFHLLERLQARKPVPSAPIPSAPHVSGTPFMPPAVDVLSSIHVTAGYRAMFKERGSPGQWQLPPNMPPQYVDPSGVEIVRKDRQTQTSVDEKEQSALFARVLEYDDGMAQTYMICLAKWFDETSGSPHLISARVHINDVLDFRGMKKHKGTYDPRQKQEVRADIMRLNDLWVKSTDTVYEQRRNGKGKVAKTVYVDSRLIEVAVESEDLHGDIPYAFRIRPGEWAQPYLTEENRQTALLLRPIMQYDPSQGVERMAMRLGLYYTTQWRIKIAHNTLDQPWKVNTLVRGTCTRLPTDSRLYTRFIDQFEEAHDRLVEDKVLDRWEYGQEYHALPKRGRFQEWQRCRLFAYPPHEVLARFPHLAHNRSKAIAASTRAGQASSKREEA